MESRNVQELLEKYFEGESTVSDEKALKNYFASQNVAPEFAQYAPMFQYFSVAKEERYTKTIPLKPRRQYYRWASVAAAVVMAFGLYFGNEYRVQKQLEQQEAQFAYEETKKALGLLAQNFEKGTSQFSHLNRFDEAKQKIYKQN